MSTTLDKFLERRQTRVDPGVKVSAPDRTRIAIHECLNSPNGRIMMDYLRAITVNAVPSREIPSTELHDHIGMCRLFGILQTLSRDIPTETSENAS